MTARLEQMSQAEVARLGPTQLPELLLEMGDYMLSACFRDLETMMTVIGQLPQLGGNPPRAREGTHTQGFTDVTLKDGSKGCVLMTGGALTEAEAGRTIELFTRHGTDQMYTMPQRNEPEAGSREPDGSPQIPERSEPDVPSAEATTRPEPDPAAVAPTDGGPRADAGPPKASPPPNEGDALGPTAPAEKEPTAAMRLGIPRRTQSNPELRDMYKKINVTPASCRHCGVLLPAGLDMGMLLLAAQQKLQPMADLVVKLIGQDPMGQQALGGSGGDGESYKSLLTLTQCESCGKRVCRACRRGTEEHPICVVCEAESRADLASFDLDQAQGSGTDRTQPPDPLAEQLRRLEDDDGDAREAAARRLGEMRDRRALEALALALEDKDGGVCEQAAKALGALEDPRAVEPLCRALGHWKPEVVDEAAQALAELRDPRALPWLLEAMRSGPSRRRWRIIGAIGRLGDPRACEPLIAELEGDSDQQYFAEALGELGDARAVGPLISVATDARRETFARTGAIRALGKLRHQRIYDVLVGLLDDTDEYVPRWAAGALGEFGDARAVEVLVQQVERGNRDRRECLTALAKLDTSRGLETLLAAMTSNEYGVSEIAAGGLGRIGDARALPALRKALKDSSGDTCSAAAIALATMGDREAVDDLLQAVARNDTGAIGAARALAELGDERAVQPLLRAMSTKHYRVPPAAAEALGRLGAPAAFDQLVQALEAESADLRVAAAEALGRLGDTRALEPLRHACRSVDWEMRQSAALGLGHLGDAHAVNILAGMLTDPTLRVCLAAVDSLSRLATPAAAEALAPLADDADARVRATARSALNLPEEPAPAPDPAPQAPPALDPQDAARLKHDNVTQHIHELTQREPSVREEAAKALGTIGDGRAVAPLIRVLADEDWRVCEYAARALGGLQDRRAVQPLYLMLNHWKEEVVAAAISSLGDIRDAQAFDPLSRMMRHSSRDIRRAAAGAIGKLQDARAVDLLLPMMCDEEDELVRQSAAESLGHCGHERALAPLLEALESWEEYRTWAVLRALGELGDLRAGPAILHYAGKDKQKLTGCLAALHQLRAVRATGLMISVLGARDSTPREIAARALGDFGDARAVEPLRALANSTDPGDRKVRAVAAHSLAKLAQTDVFDTLVECVRQDDWLIASEAAAGLAATGDPRAVEPLTEALGLRLSGAVSTVVGALGRLGDVRAVEPLTRLLTSDDVDVRAAAVAALGRLRAPGAADVLRDALSDNNLHVRCSAAEGLGFLDDDQALELLTAALEDPATDVRLAAVAALGRLDGNSARTVLAELLDSPDPPMRHAAEKLLNPQPRPEPSDEEWEAADSSTPPPVPGGTAEAPSLAQNAEPPAVPPRAAAPGSTPPPASADTPATAMAQDQDQAGWTTCPDCGARVKTKNLPQHRAKHAAPQLEPLAKPDHDRIDGDAERLPDPQPRREPPTPPPVPAEAPSAPQNAAATAAPPAVPPRAAGLGLASPPASVDAPAKATSQDQAGWTICPDCGAHVKTKNLPRHRAKCATTKSQPPASPDSDRKKWVNEANSLSILAFLVLSMAMVWRNAFGGGTGAKVWYSVLALFASVLFVGITELVLGRYYDRRKRHNREQNLPEDKGLSSQKAGAIFGISVAAILLLIWAGLNTLRSRPRPEHGTENGGGTVAAHDRLADGPRRSTIDEIDPEKVSPETRKLLSELQGARAKIAELRRRREGLAGPQANLIDQAIDNLETSVNLLEDAVRKSLQKGSP